MIKKTIDGRMYAMIDGKLYVRQYTGFKLIWDDMPEILKKCNIETIVRTYLKGKEDETL